jgi:hypothetical protein
MIQDMFNLCTAGGACIGALIAAYICGRMKIGGGPTLGITIFGAFFGVLSFFAAFLLCHLVIWMYENDNIAGLVVMLSIPLSFIAYRIGVKEVEVAPTRPWPKPPPPPKQKK